MHQLIIREQKLFVALERQSNQIVDARDFRAQFFRRTHHYFQSIIALDLRIEVFSDLLELFFAKLDEYGFGVRLMIEDAFQSLLLKRFDTSLPGLNSRFSQVLRYMSDVFGFWLHWLVLVKLLLWPNALYLQILAGPFAAVGVNIFDIEFAELFFLFFRRVWGITLRLFTWSFDRSLV